MYDSAKVSVTVTFQVIHFPACHGICVWTLTVWTQKTNRFLDCRHIGNAGPSAGWRAWLLPMKVSSLSDRWNLHNLPDRPVLCSHDVLPGVGSGFVSEILNMFNIPNTHTGSGPGPGHKVFTRRYCPPDGPADRPPDRPPDSTVVWTPHNRLKSKWWMIAKWK